MKIFWYFLFSDLEQTLPIQCVGVLHYPGGNVFCRWAVLVVSDKGLIAYHPVMQTGLFR